MGWSVIVAFSGYTHLGVFFFKFSDKYDQVFNLSEHSG